MTKRRAYLDTEFSSLNPYTYRLISLALVVPGGSEFYVELVDNWRESECSTFVREVVLPQLDLAVHGRTVDQARAELQAFLIGLGDIQIISDAPTWDWPLLRWLAGPDGLPEHVDPEPGAIPEVFEVENFYSGDEPPHHALLDARLIADLVEPGAPWNDHKA
jgi:hypothetical protein